RHARRLRYVRAVAGWCGSMLSRASDVGGDDLRQEEQQPRRGGATLSGPAIAGYYENLPHGGQSSSCTCPRQGAPRGAPPDEAPRGGAPQASLRSAYRSRSSTCSGSRDGTTSRRAFSTSAAVTSAASMSRRVPVSADSRRSAAQSAAE